MSPKSRIKKHPTPFSSLHWHEVQYSPRLILDRILRSYTFRIGGDAAPKITAKNSLILKAHSDQAVIIFNKSKHQTNTVVLSFFFNESANSSQTLMRDALIIATKKWPGYLLFTIVDNQDENTPKVLMFFKSLLWTEVLMDGSLIKLEYKLEQLTSE